MRSSKLLAFTLSAAAVAGFTGTARAATAGPPEPVTAWIERNATRLTTVDPRAPLGDLAPLRRTVGGATIVGLGESTHGASEQAKLKHRVVRLLVEQMGFRSIAWEDDWTLGLQLNDYILTGKGDPEAILRETGWQSREMLDLLKWLRAYNASHHDKVRFFGVEYFATRPVAYDAIAAYTAKVAPERLPAIRKHLRALRPFTSDMGRYVQWYWKEVDDKRPYIRRARRLRSLVERLPHRPGDRAHEVTLHHARQIVSFHEHFSLPDNDGYNYREVRAAENLRWWRTFSRDKVVYWAASPHTVNAPKLRITLPPGPDMTFASTGSYLRRWYGQRYRSIGFTFDHGAISGEPGGPPLQAPPARRHWFEYPFGRVGSDQFMLDLRTDAPSAVRRWLTAPATTRGLVWQESSTMTGGSPAQWFDAIVHRQTISPQRPL
ncbi:erythromycin esterase family protein [Actinomadura fulvescens]|uniref:Erythromycin esterase family protein n=1 Tax=Actinomadura fulvescens TaxID=46160 RepID=A0ABP6CL89_9ACTN